MYLYQNIPCSDICLPSKQAKQKRENLSDKMKLCHSKPFILGTPQGRNHETFDSFLHLSAQHSAGSQGHTEHGLQSSEVAQSPGGPRRTTGSDCFSCRAFPKGLYLQKKKKALPLHSLPHFFGTGSLTDFGDPEWLDWVAIEFQGPTYLVLPSTGIPGTCCPVGFVCLLACLFVLHMCPIQAQVLRSL